MNYFNPLEYDRFYHIYNHANGFENLFIDQACYGRFLSNLSFYLTPVADIYCYNLLRNHFHLLLKVKAEEEIILNSQTWAKQNLRPLKLLSAGKQLADCFNSYSKIFNKIYSRSGSLFKERYRRIMVQGEDKLQNIIGYIHTNAQHHKMVKDFREWPYSSYHEILGFEPTILCRSETIRIFNTRESFISFHDQYAASLVGSELWIE